MFSAASFARGDQPDHSRKTHSDIIFRICRGSHQRRPINEPTQKKNALIGVNLSALLLLQIRLFTAYFSIYSNKGSVCTQLMKFTSRIYIPMLAHIHTPKFNSIFHLLETKDVQTIIATQLKQKELSSNCSDSLLSVLHARSSGFLLRPILTTNFSTYILSDFSAFLLSTLNEKIQK